MSAQKLHSNVRNSYIQPSQKLETSQMSINWIKQTVVKSPSSMLLSDKKLTTVTNSSMDASQRHFAKWKKLDTKDYIMNGSLV